MVTFDSESGGKADDAASEASTSVASGGTELVATLTKIIDTGVADHGASNDRVGSTELEAVIGEGKSTLAVSTSLNVAQVAVMANLLAGSTVGHALGVPVRSSSRAALAQVA